MQQYYRGNRRNGLWQMSPVNTIIIVINVVVFAVLTFLGDTTDVQFMHHHGANFWPSVIEEHEYYRLLTCTFIHFGISHLFNNMLVLAYIGDNLERALGKVKYLVLYLAAGIGSSAVSAGQLEDLSSRQLMFFAGFSIYHGVTSAGIDNMAHISGFLIGALLGGLLYRRKRYWKQNSKDTAATW